jgi:hypothetical protein
MKQQILNLKKKLLLVELPHGNFLELAFADEFIGKLTDITEGQFDEWVDWNEESQYYKDYTKDGWQGDITAYESFFSYLEAHGIYFSNPLGKKPFVSVFDINPDSVVRKEYYKWEEAEQKVWNKDLIYVFEII